MACTQYQLSFGFFPSSTYSFVDCFGNTITFSPDENSTYICWADNTNPPPPSVNLLVFENELESPTYKRFDDCCGQFSGLFYFGNVLISNFVFSVDFLITSNNIVISGSSDTCLVWNETGSTLNLPYVSIFKYPEDYYEGNSCNDCLSDQPCVTPTPTPTLTPTMTPTPTPTPLPPIIPPYINECSPITLFPMGVQCNVTHPSPFSSDGSISLTITGGTPPYYITWNNGNISPIIYNLSAGEYQSTVIDSYGDFTANTTCILTGSTPTPSMTPTPTPTNPYIQYDLCMVTNILKKGVYVQEQINFTPNGLYNSRPSWISNDSTQLIIWDSSLSQWKVSASTPTVYTIINSNPAYPPIYGSWFIIGGTGNVITYEGNCSETVGSSSGRFSAMVTEDVQPLTVSITKNQTICSCDGGITLNTKGGNPPYSYSINGGLTYRNIPMFSNLCSGTYNVIVSDVSGRTVSNIVILDPPSPPITYNVKLVTLPKTLQANNTLLTKEYTTTLLITPELPDGTSINFKLSHLNLSKSSPNEDSATFNTETSLTIDGIDVLPPSSSSINDDSIINTVAGCQSENVWLTSLNEVWDSITIDNTSNFKITTITSVNRNEFVNCYVGTSDETYSLSNLKINGCSCCSVITS